MPCGRNLILLILLFTICTSCTGNLKSPADYQPGKPNLLISDHGLALPLPIELASQAVPSRNSSYVEADLMKLGSDFDEGLPHDNSEIIDDQLRLAPNYDPGAGHTDLAFSICPFTVPGYDREPEVHFNWASTPGDPSTLYIGFAHWDKNRWDWYQYPGGDQVAVPDISPYISSSDELLLALVAVGTESWWLNSLRLGMEPEPADWIHSWGGAEHDSLMAIGVDSQGAVYGAGKTKSYGVANHDCLLIKFNKYGEFVWARSWGGDGVDELLVLAIGPEDSVFAAGYTNGFGATSNDCLIQRWTSDGDLVWARTWGGEHSETGRDLVYTDEALYVAVNHYSGSVSGKDILMLKMNFDGAGLVARSHANTFTDTTEGMTVYEATPGEYEIHFCGTVGTSEETHDALYIRWSEDVSMLESYQWQGAANEITPQSITVMPQPQKRVFIAAAETIDGHWQTVTVLEFLPSGTPVAKAWGIDNTYTISPKAIGVRADGNLVIAGKLAILGDKVRALLMQVSPSAELLESSWFGSDNIGLNFNGLVFMPDQRVALGGLTYETVDGAWQTQPLNATSVSGSWASATLTTANLNPATNTPAGTVVEINTGQIDTAVGDDNAFVCAKVLE